jgi:hypothetical protein
MSDLQPSALSVVASSVAAIPGVRRLYPATTVQRVRTAIAAAAPSAVDQVDLIAVHDGVATVAISVDEDAPAPDTARRVHDLLLDALTAAGFPVTEVRVRIVQVD